jgi:protoporphyrinogen oxidase
MSILTDVAILGAGIAGLACGYNLRRDYIVFEASSSPGGVCQTDERDGFFFDTAEHLIRIPNDDVRRFIESIMGDDVFGLQLRSAIYYRGRTIPYPFQKNIYYLDDVDKLECLRGFIHRGRSVDCVGESFHAWYNRMYGDGVSRLFMEPYNTKIWCADPRRMTSTFSFDPKLIPDIDIDEMLIYALLPAELRPETEVQQRYYFRSGGIASLVSRLAASVPNTMYGKQATRVRLSDRVVEFSDGTECQYRDLISTIPLDRLISICCGVPDSIRCMAKKLEYNSVCILNIALARRAHRKDVHWLYFPEDAYNFARAYFLGSFSPSMVPSGCDSVSLLHTYLPGSGVDLDELMRRSLEQALSLKMFGDDDILFLYNQRIEYGFPIPLLGSDALVAEIADYLRRYSVHTIGRYGLWKYLGIEHAIMDGLSVNELLR